MTTTDILTDRVLVETKKTATIHAPVERVDVADALGVDNPHIVGPDIGIPGDAQGRRDLVRRRRGRPPSRQ